MMSLVDYSSDEEEDDRKMDVGAPSDATSASHLLQSDAIADPHVSGNGQTSLQLPDASELLDMIQAGESSETQGQHTSRIIAATVASTTRKRLDSNAVSHSLPRTKIPKGNLPPSRIIPDTANGILIPPQLRGRSNVPTEDLEKLFSKQEKS